MKGVAVDQLRLRVMSRSRKRDERRLPIHPMHLRRLEPDLRERIYLEHGYDLLPRPDQTPG
jgi:hypothetical protein